MDLPDGLVVKLGWGILVKCHCKSVVRRWDATAESPAVVSLLLVYQLYDAHRHSTMIIKSSRFILSDKMMTLISASHLIEYDEHPKDAHTDSPTWTINCIDNCYIFGSYYRNKVRARVHSFPSVSVSYRIGPSALFFQVVLRDTSSYRCRQSNRFPNSSG